MMKQPPRRTRATELSDDELKLFDVMFDGGAAWRSLRRCNFLDQWAYPAHSLDDELLQATLSRFVAAGMLATSEFRRHTYFHVTPQGGSLWEAERLPVWRRFVRDSYPEIGGKAAVMIVATNPEIRDDYWRLGRQFGIFPYSHGRLRIGKIRRVECFVSWRPFEELHYLCAMLDDQQSDAPQIDLAAVENERAWWRHVDESDKFFDPRAMAS